MTLNRYLPLRSYNGPFIRFLRALIGVGLEIAFGRSAIYWVAKFNRR